MSTFNEIGERGLNSVLQARANMVGGAPSPAMMPEIGPTLALEVDRPEWGYWKNEVSFSFTYTLPALAGQIGGVWWNPRPGYINVITRIENRTNTAKLVGWRTPQPTWQLLPSPPGVSFPFASDNRAPLNTGIELITGYALGADIGFDVGNGGESAILFSSSLTGQQLLRPIVLRGGGRALLFRTNAVNTALSFLVEGYLRPETQNERLG